MKGNETFDIALPFSNGVAEIKKDGKFNIINTNGDVLSPEWFDCMEKHFDKNYFKIKRRGKKNFLSFNGKIMYPTIDFEEIHQYYYDMKYEDVKVNGKYNTIDKDGHFINKTWFDSLDEPLKNGNRIIHKDNQYNLLDKNGRIISPDIWYDKLKKGIKIPFINKTITKDFLITKKDGTFFAMDMNGNMKQSTRESLLYYNDNELLTESSNEDSFKLWKDSFDIYMKDMVEELQEYVLDKLELKIEIDSDYKFNGGKSRWLAVYERSNRKILQNIITIAINYRLMYNSMCKHRTDKDQFNIEAQARITVGHEIGHGLIDYIRHIDTENMDLETMPYLLHILKNPKEEEIIAEKFGEYQFPDATGTWSCELISALNELNGKILNESYRSRPLRSRYNQTVILEDYNKWFQTELNTPEKVSSMIENINRLMDNIDRIPVNKIWIIVRALGYLNHSAFKVRPGTWDLYPDEKLTDSDYAMNKAIYDAKTEAIKKLVRYYKEHNLDVSRDDDGKLIAFREPINRVRQITFHMNPNDSEANASKLVNRGGAKFDGVRQAHHYGNDDSYSRMLPKK